MAVGTQIERAIGVIVVTIALLSMTPVIVDACQNMNTTAWNFTGYAGAKQFIGLVPFIWVAAILVAAALGMFAIAKGGKKGA